MIEERIVGSLAPQAVNVVIRASPTTAVANSSWENRSSGTCLLMSRILMAYRGGMQDEVDRLVAAWQRERPDLDVAPMQVLSRITRLALHLDRARREAFANQGLETSDFDVLSALRRAGKPYQLSPGHLVQQTLVTSGTMTHRVDRLVGKELVERLPDPADRRGVLVRLTPAGRSSVDAALTALLGREQDLLVNLGTEATTQVVDALRTLSLPFDGS